MPATGLLAQILNFPAVSRTRRNHGLEHATLHVLARRFPGVPLAGHSTPGGFRLIGNIPIEAVAEAVDEAYHRLKAGEHQLAVHPNCGTNFVTTGTLAGLAASSAMLGGKRNRRDLLDRLALAAFLSVAVMILSQPLALRLQKEITTSGDLENLHVSEIRRSESGTFIIHHVVTQG
jgi:hypothetical protein